MTKERHRLSFLAFGVSREQDNFDLSSFVYSLHRECVKGIRKTWRLSDCILDFRNTSPYLWSYKRNLNFCG